MRILRSVAAAGAALAMLAFAAAPAAAKPGDVLIFGQYAQPGATGGDVGRVVKVDPVGDPFFAADSALPFGNQDILTYALSPMGVYAWAGEWSGIAGSDDYVHDMALDGAGNVYVVGSTATAGEGYNYILLTYPNNGSSSSNYTWGGPTFGDDAALAVTVSKGGDCWFTGTCMSLGGHRDAATVLMTGGSTHVRRYNSPWDRDDTGAAIARAGNAVYVAGTAFHPGHGDDLFLIKYNAFTGARIWARTYDDPLHRNEQVSKVVATSQAVCVCGSGMNGAIKPGDAMLVSYTSTGVRRWVRFFSGGGGGFFEGFNDMQRAGNGDLVVAGYAARPLSGQDMVTAAFRSDGSVHWSQFATTPGKRSDAASALDLDYGNIYVTGTFQKKSGDDVVRTICYSLGGVQRWSTPFSASQVEDVAYDIEAHSNAVWVTGSSFQPGTGNDLLWIKYEE